MDTLAKLAALPIVQVVVGALISAWVALAASKRSIESQDRKSLLEFLTRRDRDLLELLKMFEPIPYHVNDKGKLVGGTAQTENFERIRKMYFQNYATVDPDERAAIDIEFARAETAYLLLLAHSETNDFKIVLLDLATGRGATVADLLEMPPEELRAVITEFCARFRSVLIRLRDSTANEIDKMMNRKLFE